MESRTETFHQALAITTISFNELHYGIGDGWLAPTLQTLMTPGHELYFDTEAGSWIASAGHIGKIFGCLIPAFLLDVVGRKLLIICCALTYFVVWLGISVTSSVVVICWMRFLFGVACGTNNAANTIYLGEVTSPKRRGTFGAIILILYYFGMLSEYAATTYFPYRVIAVCNVCLGLLTILSVIWLVESVQYLLLKGKDRQAEKNFMWLKGVTDLNSVKTEFNKIKQNVEFEQTKKLSYSKVFTSYENYRSVLIVMAVYSLCDATGFAAVVTYSSNAFRNTNIFTQNELTVLLGVFQFLISVVSLFFVNRFNRRPLLITAFSVVTITQACTALLFYVDTSICRVPHFPWLIFATITFYISTISFVYPAIFAIRGELFPLSVKAIGGCAVVFGNSVTNFVLTKAYLYISKTYGDYANFAIYSAFGLMFVIFMYFCLPETRNKSLVEIQEDFRKANTSKMLPDLVEKQEDFHKAETSKMLPN